MKSVPLLWLSRTPRRHRLGVEYCLVLAIAGFATLSTLSAIPAKHGQMPSERVAVDRQ